MRELTNPGMQIHQLQKLYGEKSEQYVAERKAHEKLRKAALAVIDEFTGAEDGEYPSVEKLLRALNT